jgi:hypothetical protein
MAGASKSQEQYRMKSPTSQEADNRHNYPIVWPKLDKGQPVIGALRELSLWNGVLAQLKDADLGGDKPN